MLFLISLFSPAWSQQSDEKALEMLRQMRAKFEAYSNISMDFELKIEDFELDREEIRSGHVTMSGDKIRMDVVEQLIISDGESLWTYLADVNEVSIDYFEPEEAGLLNPTDLFDIPESEFTAFATGNLVEEGVKIQVIELVPNDKDLPYHKFRLFVDEEKLNLVRTVVMDKEGVHFTFGMSNLKVDQDLDPKTFVFDQADFPGCEVVDLRF